MHESKPRTRGPKPSVPNLDQEQQDQLQALARRPSTPQQQMLRAKIVLLAHQGLNNQHIALKLDISTGMARQWRRRWIHFQDIPFDQVTLAQRLADAPRPGAPAKISPEAYCQIVALACQPPQDSGRPLSQWTSRELADEARAKGIVTSISPRQVGRFLKRSGS